MSTETEDLRVKFNRNLHPDGREQSEVEILEDEDQISDHGLQQTEKPKQKNLQAERTNCSRVLKLFLGVFVLLILAGLMTRNILLSSENDMKNSLNQMQTELSVMRISIRRLQDDVRKLKVKTEGKICPEEWVGFGISCYYKSTFKTSWNNGRSICQKKGSDLVIIDSKEEKDFVTNLNQNGESWIGLHVGLSPQKKEYDWMWEDGSQLNEKFGETEEILVDTAFAGYLNAEGKWKKQSISDHKVFICEK